VRAAPSFCHSLDQDNIAATANTESVDSRLVVVLGGEIYNLLGVAYLSIGEQKDSLHFFANIQIHT